MNINQDHRNLAKALRQLNFYLETINLPFTARDLYHSAYEGPLEDRLSDEWLDHLATLPEVESALQEPFTTHTIAETLIQSGHEALLKELISRVRHADISFAQAYIVGVDKRRKK